MNKNEVDRFLDKRVQAVEAELMAILKTNPRKARKLAEQALETVEGVPGQMTSIAMLRTIIRRADKQLAANQ
ncbi:hypothetical protein [Vibrio mediterranei]|uniref:hypothetical protein n=1 Tax=Vibrio mediterranei TaxID=689 RepID=UPI002284F80A|nr:hypothetical protein [Vibrio mediterranei]MCY9855429.1 hypothetical protein [Vibrio mediterranei]